MTDYVVDANVIASFQRERIVDQEGNAKKAIDFILGAHSIALDDGGQCLEEWLSCACGSGDTSLIDWVNDQIVIDKVRLFVLSSAVCTKGLREIGLPKKDHKWVKLAVDSGGLVIVSNDVDFFDPKKKSSDSRTKEKLKRDRSGACFKYLKKKYKIDVYCDFHLCE